MKLTIDSFDGSYSLDDEDKGMKIKQTSCIITISSAFPKIRTTGGPTVYTQIDGRSLYITYLIVIREMVKFVLLS